MLELNFFIRGESGWQYEGVYKIYRAVATDRCGLVSQHGSRVSLLQSVSERAGIRGKGAVWSRSRSILTPTILRRAVAATSILLLSYC